MKKQLMDILNVSPINKGQIIKRNQKYLIVMDKLLHSIPSRKILGMYQQNPNEIIYDEFLIYFQNEIPYIEKHSIQIKEKKWSILLKIPFSMVELKNKNLVKELEVSIKYDENLKLPYFFIETKDHFYKIYDFMEADYAIFRDIIFNEKYSFIEGTQYLKKTGYTLKNFYNKILK